MNQRGFGTLAIYIMLGMGVALGVSLVALKVQSSRLEGEQEAHGRTKASYAAFVSDTKRIGLEAQKRTEAALIKQKGVSDARIKGLEKRVADSNARFMRDGGKGAGSGGLPGVPDTAKPVDDSARDQRLLDVLRHAQDTTDRLIELQQWVSEQGKVTP